MAVVNCRCCHNCAERRQNCHAECDEYKSFRAKKDAENAKIRAEKYKGESAAAYTIDMIRKKRRKKHGKL